MGQKVNPHGLRVGIIKDWDSKWYAQDHLFGDLLVEDKKIRDFVKKNHYDAGIAAVKIERNGESIRVFIQCAKPGMIIGKGGAEIEKIRNDIAQLTGRKADDIRISIIEIKNSALSAQLVAESIALQLEKRASFRRAMKQAIQNTMRAGARGIKTSVSGRLGGAEIARSEHYHEGTIPLQTLRADIDYGFAEASTTYGRIGVKVWIYRGEVLEARKPSNKEGGRS